MPMQFHRADNPKCSGLLYRIQKIIQTFRFRVSMVTLMLVMVKTSSVEYDACYA